MGGARKFRERYSGVEGFEIHGYDRYIYTYIADKFQGDIEYNPKLIKVASLDIECECEDGFPEPMIAGEKVNAISIKPFGKETVVFGIDFMGTQQIRCDLHGMYQRGKPLDEVHQVLENRIF